MAADAADRCDPRPRAHRARDLGARSTHDAPDGERITVFAREVADPGRPRSALPAVPAGRAGLEAPRPTGAPTITGWISARCATIRVLLLDQRGTGRSYAGRVAALRGSTPAVAGRVPRALPRRRDRARRRGDPRRALGVERWTRARPELRRLLRARRYLSLAPEACARRSSPAGCRRSSATPTRSTARRTARDASSATGATSSATPPTASACWRSLRAPRRRGRSRLPDGDRLDRRAGCGMLGQRARA